LYRQFVSSGALAFDIGAHVGNRTRAFAALGCRVVALEPQPDFARILRALFDRSPSVHVVQAAIGDHDGHTVLAVSERTPTVTTSDPTWQGLRGQEPGFAGVRWNRRIAVETFTLDTLIAQWGRPAFIKIDVEGSELSALEGLSVSVPALSFEYLPTAVRSAAKCVARLEAIGTYVYNFSVGESYRLASDRWLTAAEVIAALDRPDAQRRAGDVYARLEPAGAPGAVAGRPVSNRLTPEQAASDADEVRFESALCHPTCTVIPAQRAVLMRCLERKGTHDASP
jgi:FkbM family methyltransferase